MTLIRTHRITASHGPLHGTGTLVSGSFTPSNSSLLVAQVSGFQNGGSLDISGQLTITDSAGLTWTAVPSGAIGVAVAFGAGIKTFTAPVTSGSSMTVTVGSSTHDLISLHVDVTEYTGHDTGTPIGQVATSAVLPGSGAATITFGGAPAITSEIIGSRHADVPGTGTVSATQGSGYSELCDISVTDNDGFQAQARPAGSTSTSFSWVDVNSGTSAPSGTVLGVAIEIKEAAASTKAPPGRRRRLRDMALAMVRR